jgi:hypothetical protein
MARYATADPSLSSLAADKRQGLSLVAPPIAKRRRTIKKVLIEVESLILLIKDYSVLDESYRCASSDQSPATFRTSTCQCPIHWYDLHCLFLRMNTGIYPFNLALQKKQWKNSL